MIKLDGIEIKGFSIHSDEFMKSWDEQINKLSHEKERYLSLLQRYRDHIGVHEGIDFLGEGYQTDLLTKEEMDFIMNL